MCKSARKRAKLSKLVKKTAQKMGATDQPRYNGFRIIRDSVIMELQSIFKNVQLEYQNFVHEIEPLWCGGENLAVYNARHTQEKIINHQYINLALLLKVSLELTEICSGGTLHVCQT